MQRSTKAQMGSLAYVGQPFYQSWASTKTEMNSQKIECFGTVSSYLGSHGDARSPLQPLLERNVLQLTTMCSLCNYFFLHKPPVIDKAFPLFISANAVFFLFGGASVPDFPASKNWKTHHSHPLLRPPICKVHIGNVFGCKGSKGAEEKDQSLTSYLQDKLLPMFLFNVLPERILPFSVVSRQGHAVEKQHFESSKGVCLPWNFTHIK